jgi:hypothetical protein
MTSETSQSRKYLDPEETERETEREKRAWRDEMKRNSYNREIDKKIKMIQSTFR